MKNYKLEIACFNLQSAIVAAQAGANRIELCDGISVGGITPNRQTIKEAREKITVDLFVMIRPRGGNFVYNDSEFEQMKKDILYCKEKNIDGVVFGILNENGSVNKKQNKELVELAKPLTCTFHRAFDVVKNSFQALEDIINCGFQTILTSGQKQNVVEGIDNLIALQKQAKERITIMPGGGVRSSNINLLKGKLNVAFYHSSAIIDKHNVADKNEIELLKQNLR